MEGKVRYRMYVDEVGDHSLKSIADPINKYLSLTGVVIKQTVAAQELYPKFEALKCKYFPQHCDERPIIFHRTDIVAKRNDFKVLIDDDIRAAFSEEMLLIMQGLEYEVINILIDKDKYQQRYKTWLYDTYHYCMRCLLERYHRHLSFKNGVGDVIIESRSPQADKRLGAAYYRIYNRGTEYIGSKYIQQTLSSKELKISKKGENLAGVQLADLLSFAARRYMLHHYNVQLIENFTFNDIIIETVLKNKFRNYNGRIEGFGIKMLP